LNHVVDFPLSGEREASCAQVDGFVHITATAVDTTQPTERPRNGGGVTQVFRHVQGLFPVPDGFLEPPGRGQHPHEVLQDPAPEPNAIGVTRSRRHGVEREQSLRQQGLGKKRVASDEVNGAQLHSSERIQPSVTGLLRKGQGPFTDFHRPIVLAARAQGREGPRQHVGKFRAIADPLGEAGGLAQVLEEPLGFGENHEWVRQVATDQINAERRVLNGLGQPRQGLHRLLEEGRRLAVRRPGPGISSCLPQVSHGLLPRFPSHRVMR